MAAEISSGPAPLTEGAAKPFAHAHTQGEKADREPIRFADLLPASASEDPPSAAHIETDTQTANSPSPKNEPKTSPSHPKHRMETAASPAKDTRRDGRKSTASTDAVTPAFDLEKADKAASASILQQGAPDTDRKKSAAGPVKAGDTPSDDPAAKKRPDADRAAPSDSPLTPVELLPPPMKTGVVQVKTDESPASVGKVGTKVDTLAPGQMIFRITASSGETATSAEDKASDSFPLKQPSVQIDPDGTANPTKPFVKGLPRLEAALPVKTSTQATEPPVPLPHSESTEVSEALAKPDSQISKSTPNTPNTPQKTTEHGQAVAAHNKDDGNHASATDATSATQNMAAPSIGPAAVALGPTSPPVKMASPSANAAPEAATLASRLPTHYPMIPIEIGLGVLQGQRTLQLRLSPEELGSIEIRLDVSSDSTINADIRADRPDTLAMMMRDAPLLRHALDQTGMTTTPDSLQFSLRQDGQQNMQSGTHSGQQSNRQPHSANADNADANPPSTQKPSTVSPPVLRRITGLVDVQI
jgi:flagellar hook-length control protein FliK